MGTNSEDIIDSEEVGAEPTQQYEGSDESAAETAKKRMAERDSEYSAAFAKVASKGEEKPAKRTAKPRSKPAPKASKETPPFAEDAPAGKSVDPDTASKVTQDDVKKGGLRSLKGGTDIPDQKKDRAEYLTAWRKT